MNTPWHNDCPLTSKQIVEILMRQFPQLCPITVCPVGEGWDNTTWQVNDHWLFRFPKNQEANQLLQNELHLLPALQYLPLTLPEPQWIGQPDKFFPFQFYGHVFLQGTPLDKCSLDVTERALLAKPLGYFLKALHTLPLDRALSIGATYRSEPIFNIARVQASFRYLMEHHILNSAEPWVSFFETWHTTEIAPVTVLAQGDLHAKHLLLNSNKQLSSVIDWGDSQLSHPAIDLAIAYQLFPLTTQKEFFEAYGDISDNTKLLTTLRAIYSAVSMAWYAHKIQDNFLLQESLYNLQMICDHLTV